MKTTIAFSLAATCLVLMPSVHSASFDCAKAKTMIDKLVCGDPKLSDLDDKLIALYNKDLATKPCSGRHEAAATRVGERPEKPV
jgi:uncharacterized protein